MEEPIKKAKLSATISPHLKKWMLDRVSDKDFVNVSEVAEIAIAEFKGRFQKDQEIQAMKKEIEHLKERLDTLQKKVNP
jgi:Arc/MetJ-type ribon-helix-helix transcriptional regulator